MPGSSEWMWSRACELLLEAERMHRRFFELADRAASGPVWEPPVDVLEREGELTVWVAMPGVGPESVDVQLEGRLLLVRALRRLSPGRAVIRRLEIPHGRFERRLQLPSHGYFLAARELVDGCLRLTLRRG